jgi:hypothetical protein
MKGALVFLVVFVIVIAVSLGGSYSELPPARQIYDALDLPAVIDYDILGVNATALIIAVFNGVVWGVVVWLIYSIIARVTKREKKETVIREIKSPETK